MNNLPVKRQNTLGKPLYTRRTGVMGRLPIDYQQKSYMFFGRYDYPYGLDNQSMGFSFKIKLPKIKVNIKKFISAIGKAFTSVADLVSDTLAAATKVVKAIIPPELHQYIDVIVNPVRLITNPTSTIALLNPMPAIKVLTNPIPAIKYVLDPMPKFQVASDIIHDVASSTGDIATDVYREGVRPTYKIATNVVAESIHPINTVLDNTVYKVLPKELAAKLEAITDIPEEAARRKLTDKDITAAAKAYLQVIALPSSIGASFLNGVWITLRKDPIVGGFVKDFDKYTGGIISSFVTLSNTSTDVYYDRDINWKEKIIAGLKLYLTYLTAGTVSELLTVGAVGYTGDKTGLARTPIGRDVLMLGVTYYNADKLTAELAGEMALEQADRTMEREVVQKAVAQGIIPDKDLAMIAYAYSTGKIEDGKLMTVLSEAADARFQAFVEKEIQERTGLPIKYKHLVELYNTDYSEIWINVARESSKALDQAGNILDNIGNEIARTPANLANVAVVVGNELARTSDNVVKILSNTGNEVGRIPSNIVSALDSLSQSTGKRWEDVVTELSRTPENIANIMGNVASEAGRTPENMMKFMGTFDPDIAMGDLLDKYGMDVVKAIFQNKGIKKASDLTPQNYLEVVDLARRTAPKKSNVATGAIVGTLGAVALLFMANDD